MADQLENDEIKDAGADAANAADASDAQSTGGLNPDELAPELREAYASMQADYTRKRQEAEAELAPIVELRNALADPESRKDVLGAMLQELSPEDSAEILRLAGLAGDAEPRADDEDYVDPLEQRLDSLEQTIQGAQTEQQAAEQREQVLEHFDRGVAAIAEREGRELSEPEQEAVWAFMIQDQNLDVDAAYKQMLKAVDAAAQARKTVARRPPNGAPGEAKVDLDDPEARRRYMQDLVEAAAS